MNTHPPILHENDPASNERTLFAERLHRALAASGRTSNNTIDIAREFNDRHPALAVTYHAVRKWFCGDAIPKQEKMRALADMLNVRPDWLRYGDDGTMTVRSTNLALMADIDLLNAHHQVLVREFVRLLLRKQGSKYRAKLQQGACRPTALD